MGGPESPTFFEAVRFEDGKAPDALRTIGEVATALGIRQHVLRYWEEQFPLLRPLKRSGGRRYYRPGDISLLETIDRLVHQEGYTLRGARLVLEGKAGEAVGERAALAIDAGAESIVRGEAGQSADVVRRLRTLRSRLAAALDA